MVALNGVLLRPETRVAADLERWLDFGGTAAALTSAITDPTAIRALIRSAELRGLGGSGFPVWRKWDAVAGEAGRPDKYLVVNGNEDEPGTLKDRLLLEETPHQVIEGALLAALAVGANRIVFYTNPDLGRASASLRQAIEQWQASPLLPKDITLHFLSGSGHYIGGEETAALAWIEGSLGADIIPGSGHGAANGPRPGPGFPFPRGKPPYPAQSGVFGCPTLINNVETLAQVPHIVRHGAAWFRDRGLGAAAGTKLYSLSGDILHPGVYELPMGTPLRELIYEHGGGLLSGKPLKAVFTGGPSNTLLTPADLDVALDFDSLRERGGNLGTGAMIVISEGTGVVKRVAEYVRFFAHSSCGRCPPCKTGTATLLRLIDRIDTGQGSTDDLAMLENLCAMLPGSGRCHLLNGVVQLLDSSFRHFHHEYRSALR